MKLLGHIEIEKTSVTSSATSFANNLTKQHSTDVESESYSEPLTPQPPTQVPTAKPTQPPQTIHTPTNNSEFAAVLKLKDSLFKATPHSCQNAKIMVE